MEPLLQDDLVLWVSPLKTLVYFCCELTISIIDAVRWLKKNLFSYGTLFLIFLVTIVFFPAYATSDEGGFAETSVKKIIWCLYWIGLGVLSSIGLGSGLHTFILYLGPHIAKVTLAAYECSTLNFPEPPYPDDVICPKDSSEANSVEISLLDIMSKVQLESVMWGFGTALGELPPYLIARMKRLSGSSVEELESNDGNETSRIKNETDSREYNSSSSRAVIVRLRDNLRNLICRTESCVKNFVQKVGFFGIMLCASIPNPLFDLVGITCGHYLVPISTFLGATVVGKAIIKIHIQQFFVIMMFSEKQTEIFLDIIRRLPFMGNYMDKTCRELLLNQKARLRGKIVSEPHWIASILEFFVLSVIAYFIISIINSLAQKYHSRLEMDRKVREEITKKASGQPLASSAYEGKRSPNEKNNNFPN